MRVILTRYRVELEMNSTAHTEETISKRHNII